MYVGVDIGGTKVELCRFSADYTLIANLRIPTSSLAPGSPLFWEHFTESLSRFMEARDQRVGIAMKGLVHAGGILFSSLLGGEAQSSLVTRLEDALGKPVYIDNDIRPLARAEAHFGQAKDVRSFSVVNLGTGLGVVHVEGSIVKGHRSMAGQVDLLPCWVDELSRFETYQNIISGAGIAALHRALGGATKPAEQVFAEARDGDPVAVTTVEIFNRTLARFLATVCYFYNPELIIIHGSLKNSLREILPQITALSKDTIDPWSHPREIQVSNLEFGACLGAVLAPSSE